jgi:hypothetical protein
LISVAIRTPIDMPDERRSQSRPDGALLASSGLVALVGLAAIPIVAYAGYHVQPIFVLERSGPYPTHDVIVALATLCLETLALAGLLCAPVRIPVAVRGLTLGPILIAMCHMKIVGAAVPREGFCVWQMIAGFWLLGVAALRLLATLLRHPR